MSKIKIVTDSTCDIPAELIAKYDITVVPLSINFAGKLYREGIDMSSAEFYHLLANTTELPKTSQPAPGEFVSAYEKLIQAGYQVISIHISAGLSGTYQTAELAANMVSAQNINVIDSGWASMGLGLLVLEAAKMAADNTLDDITNYINKLKSKINVFFMLGNLDNLVKGGRIGRASGFVGNLLNIKLILTFQDGIVTPVDKVRGQNKALARLLELSSAHVNNEVICSVLAADDLSTRDNVIAQLSKKIKIKEMIPANMGAIIGTYGGKGTIGIITLPIED